MSDALLLRLARAAGINPAWTDAFGREQQVSPDSLRAILEALDLPARNPAAMRDSLHRLGQRRQSPSLPPLVTGTEGQPVSLCSDVPLSACIRLENGDTMAATVDAQGHLPPLPCGYHELELDHQRITLAVAPPHCPHPGALSAHPAPRLWGVATQLYALRGSHSEHSEYSGRADLGDAQALEALCRQLALRGADAVGISPVHAMAGAAPDRYSPYSPSSRRHLNVLHGSAQAVLGSAAMRRALAESRERQRYGQARSLPDDEAVLIDWPAVTAARMDLLRILYGHFMADANPLAADLHDFIRQGGESLHQYCCFEALSHHMVHLGHGADWRQWPSQWRDPDGKEVRRFARDHGTELHFHAFTQWIAARSLAHAQTEARRAGMKIGVISDLAVGVHGGGADTWTRPLEFLPGVTIGAPPDLMNRQGQDWSLAALSPTGACEQGFQTFLDMLRSNLAFAGGIRIDHIMGLQRLWVIPPGMSPREGAYLDYPFLDQLRLLALEAHRHRALVIGEDLGTVPEGLRETLAAWNILGTRVLFFEHCEGRYPPPEAWSPRAMATTTTHDLPSVLGWFKGRDIDWHVKAGHRSAEDAEGDRRQRREEAAALSSVLSSLHSSSPHSVESSAQSDAEPVTAEEDSDQALLNACIDFVGSTPAPLVLLPVEDLVAAETQPNLPGAGDIHPNWRRRYPDTVEHLFARRDISDRLIRLAEARGRAGVRP